MSEWKEYKISELGRVITGKTPSSKNPEEWGTEVAFVTPTDFDSYNKSIEGSIRCLSEKGRRVFNSKLLPPNSVIVTCIGSQMGKVALNKIPCVTNQQINSIVLSDNFNPHFVYYLISSMQDYLRNLATGGSTMPIVNKSEFENIKLNIPSLPTQTAIAEILSSLDDKIELNNKINQELEALAQALFKQWFVDFEFPNENGEPYKTSGGEMVDSELGEIPKGWEVIKIGDVCDFISGFPFKGDSFVKAGSFGIVTIKNVQDGKFIQETDNYVDEFPRKFPENCVLEIGDVLMSLTGNVGRLCYVTKANCLLNQRVVKVKGVQKNSDSLWYYFFRQDAIKEILISISKGTAQLNLSPVETKTLKLKFPKEIDVKMINVFNEIFNTQVSFSIENNHLMRTRDTLLPKLISGELEINCLHHDLHDE